MIGLFNGCLKHQMAASLMLAVNLDMHRVLCVPGGQAGVLSALLSAGALHWACQLPGTSLTKTAMDLAAQGGHLKAMQVLSKHVGRPTSNFLLAAADSGSAAVMQWALGFWFGQFNALVPFGTAHVQQLHDALRSVRCCCCCCHCLYDDRSPDHVLAIDAALKCLTQVAKLLLTD
jgi:hypothetical protein